MRCCAYLRLSSEEQNNGVALERQLFVIETAVKKIGGILDEDDVFVDLITGKKEDRPDFQKVWGMVERKEVSAVIFNRVDRLGRDIELLSKFGKLFEKTGVKVYVCAKGGFINWEDPEDWEYWARSSVDSAKESRKIRARLKQAHEFNAHKKQANFVSPFGYLRTSDRFYAFDPEEIDLARACIEWFFEFKGNCARVAKESAVHGKSWTTIGFKRWIVNPVLRGHTPRGYQRKQGWKEILYHTHEDILITETQFKDIERLLKERSFYRGNNADKQPYTLTGIAQCSCGAGCTIMKSTRTETRTHIYVRCRAGEARFRNLQPHKGIMRYDIAEDLVIDELVKQANLLIKMALTEATEEEKTNPEVLKLEANIERVRSMQSELGDDLGLFAQQIHAYQQQIAAIQSQKIDRVAQKEIRDRLKEMNEKEFWTRLNQASRRKFFSWFIVGAIFNFNDRSVTLVLNPLLPL